MNNDELALVHRLTLALDGITTEYESLVNSGDCGCFEGASDQLTEARNVLRDVQELREAALNLKEDERRVKEIALVAYQAMPAAKGREWVEDSDHPLQVEALKRARKFLTPSNPANLQPFQRTCTRCKKTFTSKHHRDVCASCTY